MKRIMGGVKTFLLCLCLFAIGVNTTYADVNPKQLEGVLNGLVTPKIVNQSNKPQLADRIDSSEIIDPQTGALTLRQTDLSLPGKDGLDLNISRIYNSSQAEVGSKRLTVTSSTYEESEETAAWLLSVIVYNVPGDYYYTVSKPYETSEEAYAAGENYKQLDDPDNIYFSYSVEQEAATVYSTKYSIGTQSESEPHTYTRSRYDLGVGWSFAFPSLQVEEVNGQQYFHYHDGTGASYVVRFNNDTQGVLEGYQGKEVQFNKDAGSFNNGQIVSAYVYVDSDQTKTYFAEDGRLLGLQDRFGNKQLFTHTDRTINGQTYPFISQIVDSIGRTITFTYENTINDATFAGESITITVSDPENTKDISLDYTKKRAKIITTDEEGNTSERYEPYLWRVTDPVENSIYFGYDGSKATSRYTYTDKSLTDAAYIPSFLLKYVSYPNSNTYYEYETVARNLGTSGVFEAHRIKARYDKEWQYNDEWFETDEINRVDYTYTGEFSGYPEYTADDSLPESYEYGSQAANSDGLIVKSEYNGNRQQIRTEAVANNGEREVTVNQDFDENFIYIPIRQEISDIAASGKKNTLYVGYVYNDWGGLESVTQPLNWAQFNNQTIKSQYTTSYKYDSEYNLTEQSGYQNGATLLAHKITYDALGRVATDTNANNETTTYTYTDSEDLRTVEMVKNLENGKVAKIVSIYGSEAKLAFPTETKSYYTDENNIYKEVTTSATYDLLLGLVKSETDEGGNITTYDYDDSGRLTKTGNPAFTNQDGETYSIEENVKYTERSTSPLFDSTNQYLSTNNVKTETIATRRSDGLQIAYEKQEGFYDSYGNPILELTWDDQRNAWIQDGQYRYDSQKRIHYFTDAEQNTEKYSYDAWGDLNESYDSFGNLYVTKHDLIGRETTSYMVEQSNIASYRTNAADRVKVNVLVSKQDQWGSAISRTSYPNWPNRLEEISEKYAYDISGNLTSYTDPNGNTETYGYDKLDRLNVVRDALGQMAEYSYTLLDDIASVKITNGTESYVTTKEYDEFGNLRAKVDPGQRTETYATDDFGRVSQWKNAKQTVFQYSYDQMQREIEETAGATTIKTNYGFSPIGPSAIASYENGALEKQTEYAYRSTGSISTKTIEDEGYTNRTAYEYDLTDKLTSVRDNFDYYTQYEYDKDRLSRVQTNGSGIRDTTGTSDAQYNYYPNGLIESVTYPILNNGSLLKSSYEYDKTNRLTKVINTKDTQVISQFVYGYDKNGNITSITDANGTTTYAYDQLDRLIEVYDPSGDVAKYEYDLRGNRKTAANRQSSIDLTPRSYEYNQWDMLTKATKGATTVEISYEAEGLRSKKTTGEETTRYTYNKDGKVISEADENNEVKANYVWGPDRVIAKQDSSGSDYYYLYNGHQDVVQIVDTNGNIVNNYSYDEWGNITAQTEGIDNPFKYTSEVYDEDTGLYYLRARYYDPSLGRFINKDKYEGDISNPLTMNQFSYVHNNPLKYHDPTGHFAWALGAVAFIPGVNVVAAVVGVTIAIGAGIYVGYKLSKSKQSSGVGPVGKANRKQQGREVNEGKKKSKGWTSNPNKNTNRPMKKHTPASSHQKKFR